MGNLSGSANNRGKNNVNPVPTPTPSPSPSGGLPVPTPTVNKNSVKDNGNIITRGLKSWWNGITAPFRPSANIGFTGGLVTLGTPGANKSTVATFYQNKAIIAGQNEKPKTPKPKPPSKPENTSKTEPKVDYLPPPNPSEYDWNLPPHRWSLPLSSQTVNNIEGHEAYGVRGAPHDAYRRGRIWWKANYDLDINYGKDKKSQKMTKGDNDRKIGFQFLWNPETFGTQVAVQMEAVPQPADIFLGVTGAFPATEVISFNIRLDRTNDFACAAARVPRPRLQDNLFNLVQNERNFASGNTEEAARYILSDAIGKERVGDLVPYYTVSGGFFYYGDEVEKKIADLLNYGTISDLEYLYSAINGKGPGNGNPWINGRGRKTADIGFLMPTLLHVDIGPLSYEGYVTNLNVNHIAFTPDMVPIRTDVSFSMNLLATVTISNKAAEE